jgi:hypothetical protein
MAPRRDLLPGLTCVERHKNAQSQFYKTFTRPIAKVLLLAVFTYQLAYWSWVKLETDETREKTDGTCHLSPVA